MRTVTALALLLFCGCDVAPIILPVTDSGPGPETAIARPGKPHARGVAPVPAPPLSQDGAQHATPPFADVQKYIAFLEREDRTKWQRPDNVISSLALQGDETVADVGAGSGYFTFRLARALPRGKVHAMDIEPAMIRYIQKRATTSGYENVQALLCQPDDPMVPPGVDLVFISDVLNYVKHRKKWLSTLASQMEPGSRLVIVEFKEGELPEGPPAEKKTPKAKMIRQVVSAGFHKTQDRPNLILEQYMVEFKRISPPQS